jgi:peptidoglycan/LPS O-acetylase OafA/YrhL
MTWPPLLYVGTVSYGAFALHLVAGGIVAWAVAMTGQPPLPPVLFATVGVALTLAAAALSWHAFEQPLARLKAR